MATDVVESELKLKATEAIQEMNKLTNSAKGFSTQLEGILKHLDEIDKKSLGNLKNQINDINLKGRIVSGKQGTIYHSGNGVTKGQKLLEQAIIEETKEVTEDVKQRRKLRKQRADTEAKRASAEAVRVSKMEDRSSQQWIDNQTKLAEAKLINARNNQLGALKKNWRYQTAGALGTIGGQLSTAGTIGRVTGDFASVIGKSLISPAAAGREALEKLSSAIIDIGKSSVQAFSEINAIKTQLGVVFSDQAQADAMFGDISNYAVKSPFGVQQTSELAVLLKQSGVYASDLMDTLKMLGDTAGGNMEKMKRIANNYAQIMAIGKASMLDMRQFAYAGIPIFEAVSKELGVSQQELRKLISDGKVTSDIIEKIFKDITGINGIFENATEKGAKTLKARLQNLSDARQLAYASTGEWITSLGTQTGNDSYTNTIVSGLENIYQYIRESVNTRNIEKSVQAIENRENRINELQNLQGKYSDNSLMFALMTRAIGVELSKRDRDNERAIYEASYKNKNEAITNTYKDFGVESFEDLEKLSEIISNNGKLRYASLKAKSRTNPLFAAEREILDSKADKYGLNLNELYNMPKDEFNTLANAIKDAVQVIKQAKDVTELEMKYHLESMALQEQQLAFDQENKRAGKQDSLNSKFQELLEIYKESDEYKQKEEEKRISSLNEAKELLKELRKKSDESGFVDFTKYSMGEFLKYDSQGAFSASQKLDVVNGNTPANPEDVKLLRTQFSYAMDEAIKRANFYQDSRTASKLESELTKLNSNLDDTSYLDKFSSTLDTVKSILNGSNLPNQLKTQILSFIGASTLSHELTVGGENADLTDSKKGKELAEYIPLWKRIIAGATGWSAERITSTKSFMDEYQKYAAQQISRGGIQGLAGAGGRAGEIGLMLSYTGSTNKQGVRQVDWKKTEENLYKYALNLETPLKKASATMNGLADAMKSQVDTYRKLTADLYTVGEDWTTINNDIKGQYKTAQGLGNADILDNAFQTIASETDKYKLSYDEEKGLVVFDKVGDKIVGAIDELKRDGSISDSALKDFVKNVKVDNLITILDRVATETERNASVTQANADLLAIAVSLEKEKQEKNAEALGKSSIVIGAFRNAGYTDLTSRTGNSVGSLAGDTLTNQLVPFFKKVLESKSTQDLAKDADVSKLLGKEIDKTLALGGLKSTLANGDADNFAKAMEFFIKEFPEATAAIIREATEAAESLKSNELLTAADTLLKNSPLSIGDAFKGNAWAEGNNLFEQNIVKMLGIPSSSFSDFSQKMTSIVKANPAENAAVADKYRSNILSSAEGGLDEDQFNYLTELVDSGTLGEIETFLDAIGRADIWKNSTEGANKWAISLGNIGTKLKDLVDKGGEIAEQFAAKAVTSTFETWGQSLATGADASKDLAENFKQLGAGLASSLGTMITEAGLSMAIHATSMGEVMAGLAIAAAGGGLSLLGGFMSAKQEDEKEDDEWRKLLQVKQDLSDLLKQAREDAIYYENTVRHKKAISSNENFTKSVNDAIITPSGQVITTDPKDYLIATKTPKSLVGGGAPTINFSVIDKSTGIKVTQQKSTYNEDTNSIEFEAIIESKVQEVIATTKGDEAFAARQARLEGRSVIA